MTTNHPKKLDRALIRPRRVDVQFEFKKPTEDLMKKIFLSFYLSTKEDDNDAFANQFADGVSSQGSKDDAPSTATLQEHFINSRVKSAEECVAQLPDFLKNIKERYNYSRK